MVAITGPRSRAVAPVEGKASANVDAVKLLNNARSNLGWHEGANNDNPYTKHVMGDAHQPWCAAFVSTMLEQANIPGVSKKMFSASAAGLASQFQSAGRYFPSGSKPPQPGDVIFFGGRGGEHHTGIVEKVENGKVYTVEGNSSDRVAERVYSLNDPGIGGYGRVYGEGQVSNDLGLDTSNAGKGTAGGTPSGRAQGRGSASRATETGVDALSYFNRTRALMLALLEAMLNGDPAALEQALEQMFPYLSKEDLGELAKTLAANPELAAKVAANPELLQQLAADPSPEAVQQVLAAPTSPGPGDQEALSLVGELLTSGKLEDRAQASAALSPYSRQIEAAKGNGWGAPAKSSTTPEGWRP